MNEEMKLVEVTDDEFFNTYGIMGKHWSTKSIHSRNDSKESWLETISRVLFELKTKEANFALKHTWYNTLFKRIVAIVLIAICILIGFISINIRTEKRARELTAIAIADYQAEQKAIEDAHVAELAAIANSEESIIEQEAEQCAKLLYGIKNFVEKYGYSDVDLITYLRCVFNRVENAKYGSTVEDVIGQKDQWVGYSINNPIIVDYYNVALKAVQDWHAETIKPVSNDFVFAELTSNGIWLKNDFNANGYSRRYRAG